MPRMFYTLWLLWKVLRVEVLIASGRASVHNTLEFNYTPPENKEVILGRLLKILFSEETFLTEEGIVTWRRLIQAVKDGHFIEPGRYRLVVDQRPRGKPTYELTKLT